MHILFSKRAPVLIALGVLGLLILGFFTNAVFLDTDTKLVSESVPVSRGNVKVFATVSGTVRTPNTATLGFPQSGTVREVLVREGDWVQKGEILASLSQSVLIAEYNDALAYLDIQEAFRDELVAGPREESRAVIKTDAEIADAELARVEKEQEELVTSALRTLYSSDLEAVSTTETNADVPPTISGTYTCDMPTTYRFLVYPSNAKSGYSYRIIEGGTGVAPVVTESATPFSECGLFIQFDADEAYGKREWTIEVPNPRGASYTANLNSYNLALKERANAIEAAAQNRTKAIEEGALDVATPRTEELARAEANVAQARARLAAVEARIADITIRAPFDGIVTAVDITIGEVGQPTAGITMTAADEYDLRIRIPEINVTSIEPGDRATALFDAKPDEEISATVDFVSPLPTEIDGVSYFDAYLTFDTVPTWLRSGLNADVNVVVEEARNVLRIPKRFLESNGNGLYTVEYQEPRPLANPLSIPSPGKIVGAIVSYSTAPIRALLGISEEKSNTATVIAELGLMGNDGYVEVKNLPENSYVIIRY